MDRVLRSHAKSDQTTNVLSIPERRNKRCLSVLPLAKLPSKNVTSRKSVMVVSRPLVVSDFSLTSHTNNKKKVGINDDDFEQSVLDELDIENKPPNYTENQIIVGRKSEISSLTDQISSFIDNRQNASIYISGSPGTGKTAVTLHVVQNLKKVKQCSNIFINCMQLGVPSEIYSQMLTCLNFIKCSKNVKSNSVDATYLEDMLNKLSNKKSLFVILDEIDQLSSRGQDVLYRIFDWPSKLKCHIIIIGIANALDLPERLLPKLKAKSYQPIHMVFRPYTQDELVEIINVRLSEYSASNSVLDPLAIQLCARKIAASTGDVRKALDICRRANDLAQNKSILENSFNPSLMNLDVPKTPTIQHVSQALRESQVFTPSAMNSAFNQQPDLPIHHKFVLASCLVLRRQKQLREIPFHQLFETYICVCGQKKVGALDQSELVSVCELLDSRGLIRLVASPRTSMMDTKLFGTPARMKRVQLRLDDLGVERWLRDDLLLAAVMNMKL